MFFFLNKKVHLLVSELYCPQEVLIFSKNVYLQIIHAEVFSTSVAVLHCQCVFVI